MQARRLRYKNRAISPSDCRLLRAIQMLGLVNVTPVAVKAPAAQAKPAAKKLKPGKRRR